MYGSSLAQAAWGATREATLRRSVAPHEMRNEMSLESQTDKER